MFLQRNSLVLAYKNENLLGTEAGFGDCGNNLSNKVYTYGGNDFIQTFSGQDHIIAGAGADHVIGGADKI